MTRDVMRRGHFEEVFKGYGPAEDVFKGLKLF
jgi:hypothetical protein